MKKDTRKKIITFGVVMVFLVLTITPAINAQLTKKDVENIVNNIIKRLPIRTNHGDDDSTYDLLVIAPKNFVRPLKPLVCHKNRVGVSTRLVTLDEVYDQQGRDNPEKIKYFIKSELEEWSIKYVLLVGDFRHIPVRYCYNSDPWPHYPEPRFISELYYADIYDSEGGFSSWDTNDNGVYGEWSGDEAQDKDIDLYPDVYVGRLACRNNLEVRIMVKKIITYETKTYDEDWFKRIVVVAGDTYPECLDPNWTAIEGEENTERILENMSGFEHVKLWTSDGSFTGPKDVIKTINNGCGFLFFDGHGSTASWSTHEPNSTEWVDGLSVFTMTLLRNRNMLPVCVVGGCHNLQFDVHLKKSLEDPLAHLTWISECWGWKLTRKIGGGSIATIGCTGLGMSKEDKESFEGASDFLDPQFFYEYGRNSTEILGELWGKAISNYLDKYPINWSTPAAWDYAIDAKTVQQWALLGDPSLKIGGYPQYFIL